MILNSPYISGSLTVTGTTVLSGSVTLASGASIAGTSSLAATASSVSNLNQNVQITGSLGVTSTITAQTLNVQTITSSVVYSSGSNIFGNSQSNVQQMTGSLRVTGSITQTGTLTQTGTTSQILQTTANSVVGDNVAVLYNSNANSYGLYIGAGSGTNHALYCTDSTRTANLFKVQGNGFVGIGTGTPVGPLDIAVPATGSAIGATNAQQAYDYSRLRIKHYTDSNLGLSIGYAGANNTYIQACYNEGSTAPLSLNAFGGTVGIGTVNSTALLTLAKDNVIGINTTDGADNGYLALAGAGADGDSRGGHIYLSGNERGADAGTAIIAAGSAGSIQFRTGASVERIRITSTGLVGIGVTSPLGSLSIKAEQTNTPTIVFQNASGASSAISNFPVNTQTYTVIGTNAYVNNTGNISRFNTNYAGCFIAFDEGDIVFSTGTSAANPTSRIRLTSSGIWDFNSSNATAYVYINQGTGADGGVLYRRNNSNRWQQTLQTSVDHLIFYSYTYGNTTVQFNTNGGIYNATGVYGTISSDIRLKENIVEATPKLNDVMSLRVVNFNLKEDNAKKKQIGFIAQEFQNVFPSLVYEADTRKYDQDGNVISGLEDTLGINVGMEFAILVKAIQEQQTLIESLKARIEVLESK